MKKKATWGGKRQGAGRKKEVDTVKTQYKISQEAINMVDEIKEGIAGETKSSVVELAIRNLHREIFS